MREDHEGFVIWIDTAKSTNQRLLGAAEWTRSAQRVEFDSARELERFLKRCITSRDAQKVEETRRPERADGSDAPASGTDRDRS